MLCTRLQTFHVEIRTSHNHSSNPKKEHVATMLLNALQTPTKKLLSIQNSLGASMVKWTKKVLRYTKTIICGVNCLKVVAKHHLTWNCFYDDLYFCVKYSKVEYQVEIFKYSAPKVMLKSKWLSLVLDGDFMTLTNHQNTINLV